MTCLLAALLQLVMKLTPMTLKYVISCPLIIVCRFLILSQRKGLDQMSVGLQTLIFAIGISQNK